MFFTPSFILSLTFLFFQIAGVRLIRHVADGDHGKTVEEGESRGGEMDQKCCFVFFLLLVRLTFVHKQTQMHNYCRVYVCVDSRVGENVLHPHHRGRLAPVPPPRQDGAGFRRWEERRGT